MSGGFDAAGFDFAGFDTGPVVTGGQYPGPAGGVGRGISGPAGRKRKKYILDGQEISLNREELEEALETMLVKAEPASERILPAKVKPQDRGIVATFPAYPDLRDLLLAAREIEAAQVLRQVAARLADEQDERDVEELILWE